jgi:5-methyltetrahydrofolate--homocysteine methyltransferase
VIGLANDDEIPMEPQRRLEVARKIVGAAGDHGIPPEDVIIDPLAMPVGAEPRAVTLFVETLHLLREELGVNTTCGASNTSFGLPGRHTLGAAFLAVAQSHGLTSAIMDARRDETVEAVRATDFLLGRDEWGANWIRRYREKQAATA